MQTTYQETAVITAPCSSAISVQCNDTFNYSGTLPENRQMTQFGNRIPVLQGSQCVITQLLWVNQVLYKGLQLICALMFHPAFHFEARTSQYASVALIIISAPLPFPCSLSVMLSVSAQAWVSIPGDMALGCLS